MTITDVRTIATAPVAPSPAGTHATRVEVRGVVKTFGANRVLRGLDLEIEPGEFVVVVGKSGCGKTTLLRLIAGLDTPNEGQILAGGQPVNGLNQLARIMFQDARLLPWKRVLDNVCLGLSKQERARGEQVLAQVGLAERARDFPSILSGGQRQRVALARALVSRPSLLLLDEPLGALDALTRWEMQQLIEKLWLDQKFTAFLITHDVEEAVTLADRVIIIEEGQITLNLPVKIARPRHPGDPEVGRLKEIILNRVLGKRPF